MNDKVIIDFRCPVCSHDNRLIGYRDVKAVRCVQYNRWSSLALLSQLVSAFTPHYPDGTLHTGYIGAVKISGAGQDDEMDHRRLYPAY